MSGKTCDIHSLKINGSRATWQLTPDGLHIMFANNVQRRLAVDAIKSVATSANECIVQLRDAFELGSRSNKTRDNFIASFSHPDGAALFASKIKHAELQTIDISDCPSLQLANGATAYMHDDGVAWKFGANCAICLFQNVVGAVFQRIRGGSSTFDVLFIEDQCMHTIEYVPHSVLENWVEYLPDHVHKMTSGADPVNMGFLRSKLSERENLLEVAAERFTMFCEEEQSEDESEDEDSEYNPDEQSSSDEDSEMDSDGSGEL